MGSSYGIIQRGDKEEAGKTLSGPTETARIVKPKVEGQGGEGGEIGCVVLTRPAGALEEHPSLSGPALQMTSPGTARLDPHYHSLLSFQHLLTASPYSSSLTSHGKSKEHKLKNKKHSCTPGGDRLFFFFVVVVSGPQSSVSLYVEHEK